MKPFKDKVTRAIRHLALALLAGFVLTSCGGGGGQNPSSTPTNSVTAVVNQSGGAITLADGMTVTFAAGITQDATQITVSTTPDPLTSLPSGTVATSPSVRIEIPANALQSNIQLGAGITVEIPVGSATATGRAITPGNTLDAFKTVGVRISRGAQVSLGYAKYGVTTAANGTKNAAIWVGGEYLKLINVAGDAGGSVIVFVDVKVQNVQACFQGPELNKLYHVVQLPGQINSPDIYSAKDSLNFPLAQSVASNKIPLVLIHGIQALDTCANAYKTTWATFIANFYNTPELVSKYQLFTYSYDTSLAIRNEISGEGSGRNFAQSLLAVTGSKNAVVIAHSMGGLVSRSALIYDSAPIENLITLGTPHHGTTLRNIDELLFKAGVRNLVSSPKLATTALISEIAWFLTLDVQGARQLDWDNFDNSILSCNLSAGQTCNKFIKDMNSIDSNLARYSLFAGFINDPLVKTFSANVGFPDGAGDIAVPKVSALFQNYVVLNVPQYADKPIFTGKTSTVPFNHMKIHSDPSWPLVYPQNPNSVFATIQNLLLLPAAPTVSTGIANGATAVSVNTAISSTFSQTINTSTLNTSTFTLSGPSGLVAGVVTYNATTNTATFTPSTPLAYNTTYTATITTGVKDLAGNPLASNYSWGFTTGSAPAAPTGITATAGNGQATISWNAVTGAVSYNLYRASVSGVTKSNYSMLPDGMKLASVTSPYVDIGLANGKTYYYVVTAVNASGESGEGGSSGVAVTPRSILNDRVLMLSQRDGNWEIYSVGLDGSNPINLTKNPANDRLPSLSPERGRIAFVSERNGNNEIYVMTSDGANPTRLTSNSADDVFPVWSPDGKKIAFVSQRDGNYEIYVMDASGGNQLRLTNTPADESFPSWSPDSKRIAFVSKRDGNEEIYVMNADATGAAVNLTNNTASDNIPFFSPDGAWISFVSNRGGGYDLWVMDTNGSNLRKITTATNNIVGWYAWSPDGTRIAFDSKADGDYEVYVINFNGTNLRQLTNNTASDQFAAWTWDGRKIVFISKRSGKDQIYAMDPDGGNPVNVSNDAFSVALPMASPIYQTGGGCFIATAAYGSYLESEVMVLRGFRDRYLLTNDVGKVFVTYYYKWSPPVADFIKKHESLRWIVRIGLTPLVYGFKYPVGAGTLLVLLVLPFAFRRTCKKGSVCRAPQGA